LFGFENPIGHRYCMLSLMSKSIWIPETNSFNKPSVGLTCLIGEDNRLSMAEICSIFYIDRR
jgi:hypothetical protein